MYKIVILLISFYFVSCGNFYTQKTDWKIFANKLQTAKGYKSDSFEKISFKQLDTIKLRSKIRAAEFNYSHKRLPLVFRDNTRNGIYIFNRVNLNVYTLIFTDTSFENLTILTNSGEDY
jgi:endonuclease III-like uncharacterized protein